jgi:hypothetical protein
VEIPYLVPSHLLVVVMVVVKMKPVLLVVPVEAAVAELIQPPVKILVMAQQVKVLSA